MHALDLRAPALSFARVRAQRFLTEQRLRAFRPELHSAVTALVRRDPRLADLALSFPALLVALARPRAGFDPAPAIAAVIEGRPLGELAWMCGVPLWLRNFRPQMFAGAIPELPDTALFRRMIANHLPRAPRHAQHWLDTVAAASRDGTDLFALWCAREFSGNSKRELLKNFRRLCLWAWFSEELDTLGHRLIARPFALDLSVKAALLAAEAWRTECELHLWLGDAIVADMWLSPAIVDGYEFVPLHSAADIRAEAIAMNNCLRTYGPAIASGKSRLWSIRKGEDRIATLSLGRDRGEPLLSIWELKLARNKNAPADVWRAARRWLLEQDLREVPNGAGRWKPMPLPRAAWMALWRPYWMSKARIPDWLPLAPSQAAFDRL